ncbi:MAG: prepilin peptidase [Alphaproteobacteria bacterium]
MIGQLVLFVFPACLLAAAAYDLSSFRIPNWIPAALAAMYLPTALMAELTVVDIAWGLALMLGFLIVGMAMFAMRWFGGGDAKLLAAAAPWVGIAHALDYVIGVALIGGLLVLALMMFRKMPLPAVAAERPWILRLHSSEEGVPYGVALAAAGVILFPQTAIYLHMVS